MEPAFTAWRAARSGPGVSARVHDLREIVNAILYVNRTGIPWEYLPHDLPPYKTVYDYYAKWEAAAVLDAQSVKTSSNVAEADQGIDAAKKIKGRKRRLVTDTLGLLLAVIVTAASIQDPESGRRALDQVAAQHPGVVKD
ncbi:Transposase DDE domain-containing protein [Streptacidiphilus jiangxiensis]|uniref:Transposase DDE domain-containing protein n=1 Tax=Streptacidiphilus jiangxiensis TaxID=235985 RepID=A0A1H7WHJ9_STRJI|nr:Transposase DDE domain-containing protein [Streptacidiphilus jiangxiensis]